MFTSRGSTASHSINFAEMASERQISAAESIQCGPTLKVNYSVAIYQCTKRLAIISFVGGHHSGQML